MRTHSLRHLSDRDLIRLQDSVIARHGANTASLLAHLAEADARRLYEPAGYPSMEAFCVHGLGMSEDDIGERILAARAARQFPAIFEAVAEGHLQLEAICLLAPYLTPENADELLKAAANQIHSNIEELVARRFPR